MLIQKKVIILIAILTILINSNCSRRRSQSNPGQEEEPINTIPRMSDADSGFSQDEEENTRVEIKRKSFFIRDAEEINLKLVNTKSVEDTEDEDRITSEPDGKVAPSLKVRDGAGNPGSLLVPYGGAVYIGIKTAISTIEGIKEDMTSAWQDLEPYNIRGLLDNSEYCIKYIGSGATDGIKETEDGKDDFSKYASDDKCNPESQDINADKEYQMANGDIEYGRATDHDKLFYIYVKNVDTFKRGDNENYYVTEFNKEVQGRDFLDSSWTEESVLEQRINQANSMNSVGSNRRRSRNQQMVQQPNTGDEGVSKRRHVYYMFRSKDLKERYMERIQEKINSKLEKATKNLNNQGNQDNQDDQDDQSNLESQIRDSIGQPLPNFSEAFFFEILHFKVMFKKPNNEITAFSIIAFHTNNEQKEVIIAGKSFFEELQADEAATQQTGDKIIADNSKDTKILGLLPGVGSFIYLTTKLEKKFLEKLINNRVYKKTYGSEESTEKLIKEYRSPKYDSTKYNGYKYNYQSTFNIDLDSTAENASRLKIESECENLIVKGKKPSNKRKETECQYTNANSRRSISWRPRAVEAGHVAKDTIGCKKAKIQDKGEDSVLKVEDPVEIYFCPSRLGVDIVQLPIQVLIGRGTLEEPIVRSPDSKNLFGNFVGSIPGGSKEDYFVRNSMLTIGRGNIAKMEQIGTVFGLYTRWFKTNNNNTILKIFKKTFESQKMPGVVMQAIIAESGDPKESLKKLTTRIGLTSEKILNKYKLCLHFTTQNDYARTDLISGFARSCLDKEYLDDKTQHPRLLLTGMLLGDSNALFDVTQVEHIQIKDGIGNASLCLAVVPQSKSNQNKYSRDSLNASDAFKAVPCGELYKHKNIFLNINRFKNNNLR